MKINYFQIVLLTCLKKKLNIYIKKIVDIKQIICEVTTLNEIKL